VARYIAYPFSPYVMKINDCPDDPPDVPGRALFNRSTGTYWVIIDEPGAEPEALVCRLDDVSEHDGKIARYLQVRVSFLFGQEVDYGSLN